MHAEQLKSVDDALADMRDTLNVDGFDLKVATGATGRLTIEVTARPDACVECLIPKDVFVMMVGNILSTAGTHVTPADLSIVYPDYGND